LLLGRKDYGEIPRRFKEEVRTSSGVISLIQLKCPFGHFFGP